MNDDFTEKRMAGDYEIIQAVHIGDREVVLGENPQDETGMKYMCAFCRQNALFAEYSEVMASDDFPEIVELFGQRIAEQAQKTPHRAEQAPHTGHRRPPHHSGGLHPHFP